MAEQDKEKSAVKPAATDSWTKWVALTTTILAVGAAISTLRGGSLSTQTQLNTVKASNNWSYFQSKSIKQTARETEQALLLVLQQEAQSPAAKELTARSLSKCESTIARYDKEKQEIMEAAKKSERLAEWCQYRGGKFSMAAMFLQISIMLCAISALMKKKSAWMVGSCIGAIGLYFLAMGWLILPGKPPQDWTSPSQQAEVAAMAPAGGR